MRVAEVAGLRWQDIDLKQMTISVNKQIRYIAKDKKYCLTPPKTRSSQRTFTITTELVKELSAWKSAQAEQELAYGEHYVYVYEEPDGTIRNMSKGLPHVPLARVDLVCTRSDGRSYSVDCIRKQLNAKRYNSHSFRHTHATLLVEAGASIKGVANQLREPYSKHLDDGIFELRAKVGSDISRVMYFFVINHEIILTHGFIKKSQKTPKGEIERAKKYRKDYLERTESK